ncbi:sortase domain-bontaining protein [Streptomyces sp. NPDC059443]|uniref:sortase domain-containing protein n=1 Tax=unclassified Streptomyces TaxID=2593676 RepID=UPI0036B0D725
MLPVAPRRHIRLRPLVTAAAAVVAFGTLAACGSDLPSDPEVGSAASTQARDFAAALPQSRPTGLRIESAGVDAKVMVDLKIELSGELGVPDPDKEANAPGWWTARVTPGEKGVSVLVAHYDTKHGPALMKDVNKIKLGDVIEVPREDGRTARFKIREIEDVDKKNFPTAKVYGETERPELRLLTCGGEIKDGHRTNNVILYADLVGA